MVITFSKLGKYGRRGNAMFQIATTIGHAEKMGEAYKFPIWEHQLDYTLNDCWAKVLPSNPVYEEPHYHYAPIPEKKNLDLHGYFQSYRYFNFCEDLIRKKLTPTDQEYFPTLPDICGIHVRRTDYLKFADHHTNLGMGYYEQAMNEVGSRHYMVFSDDPAWCKEAFSGFPNVDVSEEADALTDFSMMISCENQIIANSSFSWWAAWLNPNSDKVVVAPKNWFGPSLKCHDTKDLIPPEWVVV